MIIIKNVSHYYCNKKVQFKALQDVSIDIPDNKFVILLGQSGSGKTTLLNIIAGLMPPSEGEIFYDSKSLYDMSQREICNFRRDNVGFIFQKFFLENCYTAKENVLVPLLLNNMSEEEVDRKAIQLLQIVGLEGKENNKPNELSGGECQRVAIARALANEPKIIIADEPTGNLDSVNGVKIIELLKQQTEIGKTIIMVTHNEAYTEYADIVINIKDGKIV